MCALRLLRTYETQALELETSERPSENAESSSSTSPSRRTFRESVNFKLSQQDHVPAHLNIPDLSVRNSKSGDDPRPVPRKIGPRRTMNKDRRAHKALAITVESLSDYDMLSEDPGRALPYYIDLVPSQSTSVVSLVPIVPIPVPLLPTPVSPAGLHHNLLHLLSYHRNSPPPLRSLISYHRSFGDRPFLYSARSYNLLISLALRNAAFGTAERLLAVMRAQGVQGDLETWKLRTRWLIRVGRWMDAWREGMRNIGRGHPHFHTPEFGNGKEGMPLPIWLEFLGTMKRGAIRTCRRDPRRVRDQCGEEVVREPMLEVVQETEDRLATDATRYKMLMQHPPRLTATERTRIPPRAVYLAVQMMLRMDSKAALRFTEAYLKGLPSHIGHRWAQACLSIIHLHIVSVSKRGLSAYHASRMTLNALLAIHPQLRPTSTTLLLLLRHLKQTRRCGTIAQSVVLAFRKRWGLRTMDQRVRRRVASLALKEGRMDIVADMLAMERTLGWPRRMWAVQKEVLGGTGRKTYRRLLRRPMRVIFGRKGREAQMWKLLRRRIRRRVRVKGTL
jgi:hypothetical protein